MWLSIGAIFLLSDAKAQQRTDTKIGLKPPVTVEFLAGNNRLFSQIIVNKPITENQKLGILNISAFYADYTNDFSNNEYLNVSAL